VITAGGLFGWSRIRWLIAVAAAPLSIALLIDRYGVDVPIWDQWNGIVPLFEEMEAGTLGLADLFSLHNEHRIFFPRLISVGLALLSGWNIRAELFLIWVMAGICSFNLWKLSRATGFGDSSSGSWLFAAVNLLLFTPLQYDNWLMGIQIVVWLPVVCTTACAWIALLPSARVRFTATALLATISTFSVASGFFCWLLTAPLLLFREGRLSWRSQRVWIALWLSSFALSLLLYFADYQKPAHHPDTLEFVNHPLDAIQFLCAYLGANFAFGTALSPLTVATVAGALLLVLLSACLAHLWRSRRDGQLLARALPWLVPPGFAVGNAVVTMVGRGAWGVEASLPSRYVTFSILLPIGLVFLVPLVFRHWREHTRSSRRDAPIGTTLTAFAASFALLHLLSSLATLSSWEETKRTRLIAKGLIEFIDVVDEPEQLAVYVHSIVPPLRSHARLLDRLGFLRPGLVRSRSIGEIADAQDPGSVDYGAIEGSGVTGSGVWRAVGWAILPYARRPADAVVLSYELRPGEPVIFALADLGRPRNDVASAKSGAEYYRSGWIANLDPVPEDAVAVKAWAFDAERGRAYRLAGEVNRR
jgi:hypothetical protein